MLGERTVPRGIMAQHYHKTEVRRRQIAEATLEVIAEEGLRAFTVRAVAARLPITDGTIFRHFANKQEIVLEAMQVLSLQLFPDDFDEGEPLARLRRFYRSRAELLGGKRAIGRLVFSDDLALAAGPEGFERVKQWRRRSMAFVIGTLTELEARGNIRSDLSVEELARVVLGSLLTFSNERLLLGKSGGLSARIDRAWDTLFRLLACSATNA